MVFPTVPAMFTFNYWIEIRCNIQCMAPDAIDIDNWDLKLQKTILNLNYYLFGSGVCCILHLCFSLFFFFFFLFYSAAARIWKGQISRFMLLFINSNGIHLTSQLLFITYVSLVHYSWNTQTLFFNNFFTKNKSYNIIHTFKNYFVIIFSIFNKINK